MTMTALTPIVVFLLIALAAQRIGQFFSKINLPYITGYLVAGMLVGPFVLDIVHKDAIEDLRFMEELSLAIIAFVAGSELHLQELRSRFKSIGIITMSVVLVIYSSVTVTVFLLAEFIPFMQDMNTASRIAVSTLVGTIMVARSPAAVIAVINELRARGAFTKTVLGVTVVGDVAIIVLFAVDASFAHGLLSNSFNISFIFLLILDLLLSFFFGYVASKLLVLVLGRHFHKWFKIVSIVLIGYAVFILALEIDIFSHNNLPFDILIEPLLAAMISSILVTNYSPYRAEFSELLSEISPIIFVLFFTLTGISLKLDILLATIPVAMVLFLTRFAGTYVGAFVGGALAGDSLKFRQFYGFSFITQAGVALGLAREVAVEFPEFGEEFATMVIAVIVLNEIMGPLFLKEAFKRVGEAHLPQYAKPEGRSVLILGVGGQSMALAEQLQGEGWQALMVDNDPQQIERLQNSTIPTQAIPACTIEHLAPLIQASPPEVMVIMLYDDDISLQICQDMMERFMIQRMIVRVNHYANSEKFKALGVSVIDPTSAMVSLLDQFVRAPQSATLLLQSDPDYSLLQVKISDPDLDNLPLRELRLPHHVLVLGINRGGASIVPHGYSVLKVGDEVTLVGRAQYVEDAALQLGY